METESQPSLQSLVRALYSNKVTSAGQLSFKKDDVITVHSKGGGWGSGTEKWGCFHQDMWSHGHPLNSTSSSH